MMTAAPPGAVAFVLRLLVRHARFFTRAATNSPLDVVGGHVALLGVGDDASAGAGSCRGRRRRRAPRPSAP